MGEKNGHARLNMANCVWGSAERACVVLEGKKKQGKTCLGAGTPAVGPKALTSHLWHSGDAPLSGFTRPKVASISSWRQQLLSLNQVQFFRPRCTSGARLLKKEQYFRFPSDCLPLMSIFFTPPSFFATLASMSPDMMTSQAKNTATTAAPALTTGRLSAILVSAVPIDDRRCLVSCRARNRSPLSFRSRQTRWLLRPVLVYKSPPRLKHRTRVRSPNRKRCARTPSHGPSMMHNHFEGHTFLCNCLVRHPTGGVTDRSCGWRSSQTSVSRSQTSAASIVRIAGGPRASCRSPQELSRQIANIGPRDQPWRRADTKVDFSWTYKYFLRVTLVSWDVKSKHPDCRELSHVILLT